jgi:hypothetical protein
VAFIVTRLGVLNESSSATHRRHHRHNCQSHCSAKRIGAAARAGEESVAIDQESAATGSTERDRHHSTCPPRVDRSRAWPQSSSAFQVDGHSRETDLARLRFVSRRSLLGSTVGSHRTKCCAGTHKTLVLIDLIVSVGRCRLAAFRAIRTATPELGEHNDESLRSLGYDSELIEKLRAARAM